MMCVQHSTGWCATKSAKRPTETAENVPTLCGCFVILPFGVDGDRQPDCPDCLAVLAKKATRP